MNNNWASENDLCVNLDYGIAGARKEDEKYKDSDHGHKRIIEETQYMVMIIIIAAVNSAFET